MAFRISERTVLELGAELISSDQVAVYELVKNAIDAKSDGGVEIVFSIAFSDSNFVEVLEELNAGDTSLTLETIKTKILTVVEPSTPPDLIQQLTIRLDACRTVQDLRDRFQISTPERIRLRFGIPVWA